MVSLCVITAFKLCKIPMQQMFMILNGPWYERTMLQDWFDRKVNCMENKDIERYQMFISVIQTRLKYFLYVQVQASSKAIIFYFQLVYVTTKKKKDGQGTQAVPNLNCAEAAIAIS